MPKTIPKTRYHLQKLTRKLERLETSRPFSGIVSGTGVRAAAYEAGRKARLRKKIQELRRERALVRAGLMEIEQRGEEALFRLTKDGVIQALRDRIYLERNVLPSELVCYVVFDVPEDVRKTRDGFRDFLRSAGFVQIQQSIWSTTKDVVDAVSQLIDELGLHKWIKVIVGKETQTKTPTAVG